MNGLPQMRLRPNERRRRRRRALLFFYRLGVQGPNTNRSLNPRNYSAPSIAFFLLFYAHSLFSDSFFFFSFFFFLDSSNHLGKQIEIKEIGWCSRWGDGTDRRNTLLLLLRESRERERERERERGAHYYHPASSWRLVVEKWLFTFLSLGKRNDHRFFFFFPGKERKREREK